jgi:hypothetical protein
MPRNTQLKPMKLAFSKNEDTWNKIVTIIETGDLVFQELNLKFYEQEMDSVYFDNWEAQLVDSPALNIVEVERFI